MKIQTSISPFADNAGTPTMTECQRFKCMLDFRFSVIAVLRHLLLSYLIILVDNAISQKTAILVKRNTSRPKEPIKLRTESFREFVFTSDMIIDRSMLIKEIMERPEKCLIITCPAKWSKTLNLDMMKTFLKIETDNKGNRIRPIQRTFAYKLFQLGELFNNTENHSFQKPFLIAQHKNFTEKYLGQYPVLYLRFKYVEGMNDAEAIQSVRSLICQSYKPHTYLLEVMKKFYLSISEDETAKRKKAKDYYHNLKRMFKEKESDDNVITDSLNLLCKLLYRHHHKPVIVLIDDFDLPFYKFLYRKYFPDSDIKYVLNRLEEVISPILADDYKYVERVIITGTYRFTGIFGPKMDAIPSFTLTNSPWLEYFSISSYNVREMFEYLGKSEQEYQSMLLWYMGFKTNHNPHLNLGTPFSINYYASTNFTGIYSSQFPEFFYWFEMNRVKPFRQIIEALINNETVTMETKDLFLDKSEMQRCKDLATGLAPENQPVQRATIELAVLYLCSAGYLNAIKPNVTSKVANIFIPNVETLTIISRKMKTYYSKVYGLPYMIIDKVVGNIGVYMMNKNQQPSSCLYERLHSMFQKLTFPNSTYNLEFEEMMYEVFNFISIKLRNLAKMETKLWKDENLPVIYLLGVRETHGVIVAFQRTQNAEELLALAKQRQDYLKKYDNLTCHKFIAIALLGKNVTLLTDCEFTTQAGCLR